MKRNQKKRKKRKKRKKKRNQKKRKKNKKKKNSAIKKNKLPTFVQNTHLIILFKKKKLFGLKISQH